MSAGPASAMGPRDYDYLTLANDWCTVHVEREPTSAGPAYVLSGDASGSYATLTQAMTAAWRALAEYEQGRCD